MLENVQKLFKKPDPKELVRKWQADLRAEQRRIDRQIRDIQFEEKKVHKSIKEAAKRNDIQTCKVLAKEIIQSRRAVSRLYVNKAQMISIGSALTEQLAMVKVAGHLHKSTEVMKMVNDTLKMPELQRSMMEMSREMAKAGLIDEVMNDAIDSALGDDEMEEETEAEISKVLQEVAGEVLAAMPAAKAGKVAAPEPQQVEEEDDMENLRARLDAVRG